MSDTPETVGDLDDDRQTWAVGRRAGGHGRVVHLSTDCYRLAEARHVDSRRAAVEHDDTRVCPTCAGQVVEGKGDQDWSIYRAAREAGADD